MNCGLILSFLNFTFKFPACHEFQFLCHIITSTFITYMQYTYYATKYEINEVLWFNIIVNNRERQREVKLTSNVHNRPPY